jgi:hypothetical protein
MNVLGRTTALGPIDSGQHWLEDFLSQEQECGEGSDSRPAHSITPALGQAFHQ